MRLEREKTLIINLVTKGLTTNYDTPIKREREIESARVGRAAAERLLCRKEHIYPVV